MFYPDIKPHISPSAFQAWHQQRSLFIRSYFKGEKTPETSAMKAGKKIHAMIEGGFIPAIHRFSAREKELVVTLPSGVNVLGIPDSHEEGVVAETVSFVDYKTGRENGWTREQLAVDLKMRVTAWLVLQANPGAQQARAIIEWIGTEWNGAELVPVDQPHECIEYTFTKEDLFEFDTIIASTIEDINVAYEQFLESVSTDFVEEADVLEYAELEAQAVEIEKKQKAIKDRIAQQLEFAGKYNYDHPLGSFYFTMRRTYEYPPELEFITESGARMTVQQGEEISLAMGSAKKNYELDHEPASISKSISFRAKKKK